MFWTMLTDSLKCSSRKKVERETEFRKADIVEGALVFSKWGKLSPRGGGTMEREKNGREEPERRERKGM